MRKKKPIKGYERGGQGGGRRNIWTRVIWIKWHNAPHGITKQNSPYISSPLAHPPVSPPSSLPIVSFFQDYHLATLMFYYCFIIGRLTVYMVHSATEGGEERERGGGKKGEWEVGQMRILMREKNEEGVIGWNILLDHARVVRIKRCSRG